MIQPPSGVIPSQQTFISRNVLSASEGHICFKIHRIDCSAMIGILPTSRCWLAAKAEFARGTATPEVTLPRASFLESDPWPKPMTPVPIFIIPDSSGGKKYP